MTCNAAPARSIGRLLWTHNVFYQETYRYLSAGKNGLAFELWQGPPLVGGVWLVGLTSVNRIMITVTSLYIVYYNRLWNPVLRTDATKKRRSNSSSCNGLPITRLSLWWAALPAANATSLLLLAIFTVVLSSLAIIYCICVPLSALLLLLLEHLLCCVHSMRSVSWDQRTRATFP